MANSGPHDSRGQGNLVHIFDEGEQGQHGPSRRTVASSAVTPSFIRDFRGVVGSVIALGGDTDTTGATAGALAGTTVGAAAIPVDWLAGLCEWPRSTRWLRRLAVALA